MASPARTFGGVALMCGLVALSTLQAPTAHADPIADAKRRIAELEQRSAAAASQAAQTGSDVAASRERLELFNRHVERSRAELAAEQAALVQMARQLYVNGGVSSAALSFALDDPDQFIADLDRLAVAGTRQNTVVEKSRERALSMKSAQEAAQRELSRLANSMGAHEQDQRAADEALASVRQELADLEAEQRRIEAEQEVAAAVSAAIAEAELIAQQWRDIAASAAETSARASTALASGATFPSAIGPAAPSTSQPSANPPVSAEEDLGQYGDSAAWASSAKSQSVIMCESGGDYTINTGNGYYGAWQFDYPSWHYNNGGVFAEYPHQATKAQQDYVAWTYWLKAGWRPWECG